MQAVPATLEGPITSKKAKPTHAALVSGSAAGISLVRGNHPLATAVLQCPIKGIVSIWPYGQVPRSLQREAEPWALCEGDGCVWVRAPGVKLSTRATWPVPPPIAWPGFGAAPVPEPLPVFIREVSLVMGVPEGFAALLAVGAIAAAVCSKVEVSMIGETGIEVWRERTGGLFFCGIAPSGARKTPLLEALLVPWREMQRALQATAPTMRAKWLRRVGKAKARIATLLREDDPDDDELTDLYVESEEPEPRQPAVIVANATGPALSAELAFSPSVFVATSEASELFQALISSDGQMQLAPLLKAYSGEGGDAVLRIGRKQPVAGTLRASVLVLAQPSVLYGLAKYLETIEQGLFARFLWVSCDVVTRPSGAITAASAAWWHAMIKGLTALRGPSRDAWGVETGKPRTVCCTPDQTSRLLDLETSLKPRIEPGGDLFGLGTWARKLHGQIARMACVLTLACNKDAIQVDEGCFQWAMQIALTVLLPQAVHIWGLINWPSNTDDARHIWALAHAAGVRTLSVPALDAMLAGIGWNPERVDSAIATLCKRGFAQSQGGQYRSAQTVDFSD